MVTAAFQLFATSVGQLQRGMVTLRNHDVDIESVSLNSPIYAYGAVCRCRRTFTPVDVAHGVRRYQQVVAPSLYAQQVGYEEIFNMSHHEVVHRCTMLRIPLFGECCHALLDLIAIAWYLVVVEHAVEQLPLSTVDECFEEIAVAYIARGQSVTMLMDISHELV